MIIPPCLTIGCNCLLFHNITIPHNAQKINLTKMSLWVIIEILMENEKLQTQLEKTKAELSMLYEIGNAMMATLKLEELLYIILTAVTAKEGLGFNRAMLFL